MLAGDSRGHRIDLVNDGDTALGSVTFDSWATSSSILDTDAVDGLQLSVESVLRRLGEVGRRLHLRRHRAAVLRGSDRRRGTALSSVPPASRRAPPTTCS